MRTIKDVARDLERTRLREEALAGLRKRTARNVPLAIFYFLVGCFWWWRASTHSLTGKIDGKDFLLIDGILYVGSALMWMILAVHRLSINPRNKLLLLLAEEAFEKEQPNQAREPAATAVTAPAAQEPLQP